MKVKTILSAWWITILVVSCIGESMLMGQSSVLIHAHNDYLHERPFWGALEAGCASIEVDIILREDTLFVAHELESIEASRTFEAMYLQPLHHTLQKELLHYPLQLLIDLKTSSASTLPRIVAAIETFPALVDAGSDGSITFAISGNRPPPEHYADAPAFISFDYQALATVPEPAVDRIALVSLSFRSFSSWDGKGKLKGKKKKSIRRAVKFAHKLEKPFRLWATPDTQVAWQTLVDLGVDYINTDKVQECAMYFGK